MALLAKSAEVDDSGWVDLNDGLGLADGTWYEIEVQALGADVVLLLTVTDSNKAPAAGAAASILYARTAGSDANRKVILKSAGQYWWSRAESGRLEVVALPTFARAAAG